VSRDKTHFCICGHGVKGTELIIVVFENYYLTECRCLACALGSQDTSMTRIPRQMQVYKTMHQKNFGDFSLHRRRRIRKAFYHVTPPHRATPKHATDLSLKVHLRFGRNSWNTGREVAVWKQARDAAQGFHPSLPFPLRQSDSRLATDM